MRRKVVSKMLCITMMMLTLAGCGQATSNETDANQDAGNTVDVVETKETDTEVETSTDKKTLTIYSSTNQEAADAMVEIGKEIGIDVTIVLGGGGEVVERIIAEKENPTADLIYGSNSIGLAQLKAENTLEKFTPEWKEGLDAGVFDPDGYYYGVSMSAIVLAYNQELLGKDSPKDWTDLWTNPNLKGKYFVSPSTSGGTTRLVLAGILSRYKDEQGDLGVSEEGWNAVRDYYANAYISQEGDNFLEMLTSGKTGAGQNFSTGIVGAMETYATDIRWATPEVGVPIATEMVAIMKNSKNHDTAVEFLNYFGSAKVQAEFCETVPTLPEGRINVSEELNKIIDSVKIQQIDYDWVAANLDSWIEKIELEYIP